MSTPSSAGHGIELAEFAAIETVVRYYEGTASAAELAAARERLHRIRQVVAWLEREQAARELFAFPRRPEPPREPAGQ